MADISGVSVDLAAQAAAKAAAAAASTTKTASSTAKKGVDMDSFLKLLTAEMKYQDPLEPMKNTDSMAQLAQFSSLQQTQDLSKTMSDFVTQQKAANTLQQTANNMMLSGNMTLQAAGIIGKDIEAKVDGATISGQVSGFNVTSDNGVVLLCGGKQVPLSYVYSVKEHTV